MTTPKLTSRRLALLSGFALLGVMGAVSVCNAESPWRRRMAPPAPPPDRVLPVWRVSLEDRDGAALPTFRHAGERFVLGEPGARYNVRVENPTAERVEVVVTIDGRDAISGKVGDYTTQRGYLIEPWGSLVVEGFRRSLDEVAAFRFTDRSQSYSALRGTAENVGVIGVAVFPEKSRPRVRPRPYSYDSYDDRENEYRGQRSNGAGKSADAAPASPAEAPTAGSAPSRRRDVRAEQEPPRKRKGGGPSNIGTQYGEREESGVVEVAFERRSKTHPSALLTLRYDDYNGLAARDIDLSSLGYSYREPYEAEPEPFPYSRFAPPPNRY